MVLSLSWHDNGAGGKAISVAKGRDGAVMRALAFHQCGPGSLQGLCVASPGTLVSGHSGFPFDLIVVDLICVSELS